MLKKLSFCWGKSWLADFKISRKIGVGYSLAIGIAVLGTTVGLIVGDYYQREAQNQLFRASRQRYILDELEHTLLKVRSHPQQLIAVLDDSIWFQYEINKFTSNVDLVRKLLSQLDALTRK
ncbi:MAG: histidine kinase, partial [Cyanobacteriota bacterium]|nr:histidine kinase [Cyanobacteriota bacterium]